MKLSTRKTKIPASSTNFFKDMSKYDEKSIQEIISIFEKSNLQSERVKRSYKVKAPLKNIIENILKDKRNNNLKEFKIVRERSPNYDSSSSKAKMVDVRSVNSIKNLYMASNVETENAVVTIKRQISNAEREYYSRIAKNMK